MHAPEELKGEGTTPPRERQFPCKQCGASLVFAPGTDSLQCPYCGSVNELPKRATSGAGVQELDFRSAIAELPKDEVAVETLTVKCGQCGAQATLRPNVVADRCPFCATPIVAVAASTKRIKPRCVLPFKVTRDQAVAAYQGWLAGLWFAPSNLKQQAAKGKIDGLYLPAWTYDADCTSAYTGQRGDDYWETEHYTTTENGRTVTKTRQVRKTRWRSVAGTVQNAFDDLLVMATDALPQQHLAALEPWDVKSVAPYADEYLSGFVAMSYDVDLHQGFTRARQTMDSVIEGTVRQDIGGDHQQISSCDTTFGRITFKHILLPLWLSAYQYQGKTFRFLVNARTGEVQGERPYSWLKIATLVLLILIAVLAIIAIANSR